MNITADKAIRWSTVAAVTIVALVAAFVSYRHALTVVEAHGETTPVAQMYPLTIDGLIFASSMVLLVAARRRSKPHKLAYVAISMGIAATLAANIAAGIAFGFIGALVAAWPAPSLVVSYELLMLIVRSAGEKEPEPAPAAVQRKPRQKKPKPAQDPRPATMLQPVTFAESDDETELTPAVLIPAEEPRIGKGRSILEAEAQAAPAGPEEPVNAAEEPRTDIHRTSAQKRPERLEDQLARLRGPAAQE